MSTERDAARKVARVLGPALLRRRERIAAERKAA